jgi:peptidyl-prolyl cis-trans isomerase D
MADAADKLKLTTGDARLARELAQNPNIAELRGADGKMDMDRYRQLAASQGLSPEGFEARVRKDLSVMQVEAGVSGTGFSTPAQAAVSLNAFFEKRDVQFTLFKPADFTGKVTSTDAEIETFYKDNQGLFKAAEAATVEYVVLDIEAIKKSITLNEADVKTYFEQNQARLSGNQERRASHILINSPKGDAASKRDAAKAKAQELLAQVRKTPDSFADLAKKNSQDTGSAANGGDLDFFGRGAMVKPFEDAVFAMKKGDISDVVESDFGYHIIKLTDVKEPKQKTFEELRAGIESDLKTQQAKTKYAESAEAFTNGVYEQSDSLKPVADKLKLEIKTVANLSRQANPAANGVLTNAKLLTAIFAPDSIDKKRNTEAVETGPSQLVSARVAQYAAAHTLPLAEVKSLVKDRLIAQHGIELAKKEGADKLAAWKANPATATLPGGVVAGRNQAGNVPPQVLDAVLKADSAALPAWVGVDLGLQGYAVARVNAVLPRAAVEAAAAKQELAQYSQAWTAAESMAYYNGLKERFKAQILVPKPVRNAPEVAVAGAQ